MQENGSDFTLSKPTEGVKLSGAATGGATVNGSTLWRHPLGGGRRCNVRIGSSRSAVTMNISWHRLLLVRISQATGQRRYLYQSINRIFYPMCALHTWDNLYRQNNDSEIQSFLSVNQSRESPDFPEVLKNAHNTKETRGIKV